MKKILLSLAKFIIDGLSMVPPPFGVFLMIVLMFSSCNPQEVSGTISGKQKEYIPSCLRPIYEFKLINKYELNSRNWIDGWVIVDEREYNRYKIGDKYSSSH